MSLSSMTGFAAAHGAMDAFSWSWDIRSVNAKGLDLRLRVPDWLEGLENKLKSRLAAELGRGNVSLALRLSRTEDTAGVPRINPAFLAASLDAISEVEKAAKEKGIVLSTTSAADILGVKGVLEQVAPNDDPAPLIKKLLTEFDSLLNDFINMRRQEGAALQHVLLQKLDRIAELRTDAAACADERKEQLATSLQSALQRVLDNSEGADPDRVAQELALIAVKVDIAEELDRLDAHVAAARTLVKGGGLVGRKLDFLMQEFNREANTLCSKAQNADLTAVGLELKTVIDQMREQVQNIE